MRRRRIIAGHVVAKVGMVLLDVGERIRDRGDDLLAYADRIDPGGATSERLRSDYATLSSSLEAIGWEVLAWVRSRSQE